MCCLFGLIDIKHRLSGAEKARIISILAEASEARGIDATGYPYEDPVAIVCNEEGKLMGMEPNRAVRDPDTHEITDIICGTFFICGLGEEDFCSLTEEQATKYSKLFHNPEVFLWNGTNLVVLPVSA